MTLAFKLAVLIRNKPVINNVIHSDSMSTITQTTMREIHQNKVTVQLRFSCMGYYIALPEMAPARQRKGALKKRRKKTFYLHCWNQLNHINISVHGFMNYWCLKTMDTIGNCQRLVFTVGVSQHMHKITNLWKFELNQSSNLRDNNEKKKNLLSRSCALSDAWFRDLKF